MATRTTRANTRSRSLTQRRINFPEIPPPPPTNEDSFTQSTPRIQQENRDFPSIENLNVSPTGRINPRQEKEEDELSDFHESVTRGSNHPSHQEEHDYEGETSQPQIRRHWRHSFRNPDSISDLDIHEDQEPTEEDRLMAAQQEEIRRVKQLDKIRKRNKYLEDERKKEESMYEAFEIMRTNKQQQDEELHQLLKENRIKEKQLRDLRKKNRNHRNNDPDPEDPSDPDGNDSDEDDPEDSRPTHR